MTVTLQDVAKLAGVSVGTASQALNNNPKVTDETRSRVVDAARTLGYAFKERSNLVISRQSSISVIGVLSKHDLNDVSLANPFYNHIISGIEVECRKQGISLMLSSIEVDLQNRPVEWPAMLEKKMVDGIIFIGTQVEDTAQAIRQRLDVPIVLVDSYAPNLYFDSVLTDNFQGAELAVQHLIELGHRHIGLIGSKENSVPSIAERRNAYIQTMKAHGIFNEKYIENSELHRPDAHKAAILLLQRYPEITAFFACNDDTAAGVMAATVDLGLKVPRSVSVVGFDNIALAGELSPPLTTIHIHKNWMGILGVRFLLERSANPEKPKSTTYISTQLVVRKSTAPPRM